MSAIAGAFNVRNASRAVRHMLFAMQHRGQDGVGIVSSSAGQIVELVSGFGSVDRVFGGMDFERVLPGEVAIGHLYHSPDNEPRCEGDLQPVVARRQGDMTIVHDGNLTNADRLRSKLTQAGAILRSTSHSELILHVIARSDPQDLVERMQSACAKLAGSYSMLLLTQEGILAVVDPCGFRPLNLARLGDGYLLASETCAFDILEASDYQVIQPGTIVQMSKSGLRNHALMRLPTRCQCAFEHIYHAHPSSRVFGVSVHQVRARLGMLLGQRNRVAADLVTPVPDSSNAAALAFAAAAGIPFQFALTRSHYAGRTFLGSGERARELGVRAKVNVVRELVEGQRILVVDDSIVRGTTARKLAGLLRRAGAREVHMAVVSPPVIHPCFWGIDTPERKELIAATVDTAQLAGLLGLDSLSYLTHEELLEALKDSQQIHHCTTCFSSVQPVDFQTIPSSR